MNQNVSPKAFFVILTVALVVAIGVIWRVWTGPSATAVPSTGRRHGMERPKTTEADRRELEEWKKQHPGAFTRE